MKILVTGALGFVGSNLAVHYAKNDENQVVGIDNRFKIQGSDKNYHLITEANVKYKYCDIRSYNDVIRLFDELDSFDVIFHMASQVAFKCSVENPRLDFEINALGTFNILEAVRCYNKNATFVYASTNQVYGELKNEQIKEYDTRFDFVNLKNGVPEDYVLDFLSPYGCSKGTGDIYVRDYGRVYDMKTVVARFGGIYGVNQYSYEDHGWISFISEMIIKNRSFNRFGHGKQVRDILYISDILEAMDCILKNIDTVKGEALNIGGGGNNTLSVLELLQLVEEITGNKEKSVINPMRKADKVVMYLDIIKAKNKIHWEPKVGVKEGVTNLINWLKNR
jgi:CDP-paratose 2-epimerase